MASGSGKERAQAPATGSSAPSSQKEGVLLGQAEQQQCIQVTQECCWDNMGAGLTAGKHLEPGAGVWKHTVEYLQLCLSTGQNTIFSQELRQAVHQPPAQRRI